MTDIEAMLLALQALVDQYVAEWKDPETTLERRQEIADELRPLYYALVWIGV